MQLDGVQGRCLFCRWASLLMSCWWWVCLCRQPLVPVIDAADGRWLLTKPLKLMMKPGGHGAIWKLMHDEGGIGSLKLLGE